MDPTRLMTQTAAIVRRVPDSTDGYGDETTTDSAPVDSPCLLAQTNRAETTSGTNSQDETFSLYLPADTSIDGHDKVTVDGFTYELVGPPWAAFNPRLGRTTHLEATCRRVT